MANELIIKKSTVAGKAPVAGDLEIGELAVNTADAKLYTKHSDGTVKQLSAGPKGDTGATGAAGPINGAKYTFSSSTVDADPGNGVVRYNNSTPILISYIYINLLDANNNLQQDWINSWDDISTGTYRGVLTFQDHGGSNATNVFRIAGAVGSAFGYARIPVTHVSGTLFTGGETLSVVFSPTGPQGIQGLPGATGANGAPATITVGTTTTGAAGSSASVTNSGSANAVTLNFTIPRGDKGDQGNTGTAATIAVGTVTTGDAGSSASVTNSGTSSAATLNFSIPQGIQGETGPSGLLTAVAPLSYNSGTKTISGPAFTTYSNMGGVTTTATAVTGATTITVASGTGILNGYYVAGPGIVPGTTVSSGGGTTSIVLSSAIQVSLSATPVTFYNATEIVNPAVSSPGIAKAWARFALGTGSAVSIAATVTRISGNNLATVTTTSVDHGLITGNMLQLSSATLTAAVYTVTVTGARTFTITTGATTAINAQAMTITGRRIIAGYNVNFISAISIGNNYMLNFSTPFPDINYGILGSVDGAGTLSGDRIDIASNYTTAAAKINLSTGSYTDIYGAFVSVFR
jgi:hypothetical protein